MAPDLNSVSPSPRSVPPTSHPTSTNPSRRGSQLMGPPPPPTTSLSISNSSHQVLNGPMPSLSPPATGGGGSIVADNSTPMRHPRPLTAADLHLQMEKEQEAVVNRLTRELSNLRAQTASVASTTSSTSTGVAEASEHSTNHLISGPTHPTPSRRHRSSSSLSTRSINTSTTSISGVTGASTSTAGWSTGAIAGSVAAGPTQTSNTIPPGASYASSERTREGLSRQNSVASSRRSGRSSPMLSSSLPPDTQYPYFHPSSRSMPTHPLQSPQGVYSAQPAASPERMRSASSSSSAATTARYEEVAFHRAELETVRHENNILRRRVRELERELTNRRQSAAAARVPETSGGIAVPGSSADDKERAEPSQVG
ncbi:MAG: hypothetical protein M1819_003787 [Sarea resinae]|nr:MAG: hypothetical protein M1819_003787 [Sarea resinae]